MKQWIAVMFAVVGLAGAVPAHAQEAHSGAGAVVVTVIPAGGTFFTQGSDTKEPSFGNYGVGGAAQVRINRYVGVEGEVVGAFGVTQNLDFTSGTSNLKTPNLLSYNGNVVVSVPTRHSIEPYVTGGVGGLTVYSKPALAITDTQTFFTSNVGGGVTWFNGRWGLRADYRFLAVKSNTDAPAFFGQETRYGHRIYGGLLINVR
ncbi:MAG TPA: outer membrane beta-barrel protein [Vicinamibacterales bacterium]